MLLGAVPAAAGTPPLAFGGRTAALELSWKMYGATVEPWPFAIAEVEVSTPARRLDAGAFESAGDCACALATAPVVTLRGRLAGRRRDESLRD
jgi:hypothetical protein